MLWRYLLHISPVSYELRLITSEHCTYPATPSPVPWRASQTECWLCVWWCSFWGRTRVSLRAETPDELFVWLNRYLISLPAFGTLTQLEPNATAEEIAAAAQAGLNNSVVSPKSLKKAQLSASGGGGSSGGGEVVPSHPPNTYFDSSELWSYKICSEKAMLRDQGGYSAQMMSGGGVGRNQRQRRFAISSSGAYINLDGESEADKRFAIVFLPGEGAGYSFYYKGVKIWVNSQIVDPKDKDKQAAQTQYDPYTGEAMAAADSSKRVLTLSVDVKNANLLNEIVRDAIAAMRNGSDQKLGTYKPPNGHTATFYCQGEYTADTFCHPELPILPGNTVKSLLEDFYKRMGVPYRRGYLFYGVPGTGKTTLVRKMAAAHKLDVCMVSLSNNIGVENYLQRLFASAPHHSILLIEDIDVAFPRGEDDDLVGNRDEKKGDAASITVDFMGISLGGAKTTKKLSMSELFNAIDGIAAQTGCILVMTTNHIEHLDPALIRSGRIDVKIPFDFSAPRECALAYHRFYPDMTLTVPDEKESDRLRQSEADRKKSEELEMRKITREVSFGLGLVRQPSDGGAGMKKKSSETRPTPISEAGASKSSPADQKSAPTLVVSDADKTKSPTADDKSSSGDDKSGTATGSAAAKPKDPLTAAQIEAAYDAMLAEEEAKLAKSPEEEEKERLELGVSKLAYAFGKRAGRLTRKPRLTMSDIQGHLLKYRESPQVAYVMIDQHDPRSTAKAVKTDS